MSKTRLETYAGWADNAKHNWDIADEEHKDARCWELNIAYERWLRELKRQEKLNG